MSWENKLKEVAEHLTSRKWFWSTCEGANRFKYISIKVDTRTNNCFLTDRSGKEFELEELLKIPDCKFRIGRDTI